MEGLNADVYTCVSAGIDWLTATGDSLLQGYHFWGVGDGILQKQRDAGVDIKPASLRDYKGRRGSGVFVGKRTSDSIIVLSGPQADEHFAEVTAACKNVSRLDVQCTYFTHGEEVHLARDLYTYLKDAPPRRGKPPTLTYIERHPTGETMNYGSRSSDSYGRLYDKASEEKSGPAGTLWRAEVELKRSPALHLARTLAELRDIRPAVESMVGAWWLQRGLRLPEPLKGRVLIELSRRDINEGNELAWLARQTPRAVRRAIRRHGIQAVIDALGLTDLVEVKHANRTRHRD